MVSNNFSLVGNIVNVFERRIYPGEIIVSDGKIVKMRRIKKKVTNYILPGLMDAHVHIESSMLIPTEFARIAVRHGTVGALSDPHEIANVMGMEGVRYMINNGRKTAFKFYFGAPSCVPATNFETAGSVITTDDIKVLFSEFNLVYLAEMMNFPGVIKGNKNVLEKINMAKKFNRVIDGHAPEITGRELKDYINAGITTDHECTTLEEANEKIQMGMKILIREGSAAKNFNELIPLIKNYPEKIMFCSDDMHPDDLMIGHINKLISRGIQMGYNAFDLIKAATVNISVHYNINAGLLRVGDPADIIMVRDLMSMDIFKTFIGGEKVFEDNIVFLKAVKMNKVNRFNCNEIYPEQIKLSTDKTRMRIIKVSKGSLFTRSEVTDVRRDRKGFVKSSTENDILKIVVLNRYHPAPPAIGFIKGFGFRYGAIASSVAHDSHNIIAVGVKDELICRAVNWIIKNKGGMVMVNDEFENGLVLDVAGIMSDAKGEYVSLKYKELTEGALKLGSKLEAPFMTLSFMALLVIPELKIGDRGLFDVNKFEFTELFV